MLSWETCGTCGLTSSNVMPSFCPGETKEIKKKRNQSVVFVLSRFEQVLALSKKRGLAQGQMAQTICRKVDDVCYIWKQSFF